MVIYKTRNTGILKSTITAVGERRTGVILCINRSAARPLVRTWSPTVWAHQWYPLCCAGGANPFTDLLFWCVHVTRFPDRAEQFNLLFFHLEVEWSWVLTSLSFLINIWSRGFTATWTSQSVWQLSEECVTWKVHRTAPAYGSSGGLQRGLTLSQAIKKTQKLNTSHL